ncbi:uncharacterized protein LOC110670176 [Hevea brasiliensis]|uniref:uncharacterized protein LOC110670176 n=1 Tax=Hevea brasiliensis TaxID=3981 RepID=UPI0025FB8689|nr:uncharacterized protein LOC110670176 [Hevea brasiliensis]
MVSHITNMEDGGQFGGRALIVWFSGRLHSFTRDTWTCILTRCPYQCKIMQPGKGTLKILQCLRSLPMLQMLLQFGCKERYEIGSSGVISLKGQSERRNKCLNDFISLYGTVPLVSKNVKALDARREWFW